MVFKPAFLVLTATAFSVPVLAQTSANKVKPEREIERTLPLINVAGLRPVASEDLTSPVTVLTADMLAVRDAPFLADQLRVVPGLAVSRSGAIAGLTQVRMRGAEANHTLVLLDGIEISDPTTGETDFGLFSGLSPARIEVARGEQSALYGSDAIGGVINLVTGGREGPSGHLEAGSFGTLRLDAAYGTQFDRGTAQFVFADVISDGVDTSGRDGEKDGYQNYSGLVSGRYDLNQAWQVQALARYVYGEVDTDPDLDFDGILDNADRVTESAQVTLGGVLNGQALGLDHQVHLSYNQVERENFGDGASLNISDADRTKLAYSPAWTGRFSSFDLTLSGLVDWEREEYTAEDTEFGGFTNQSQSFETLGLAAEARLDKGAVVLVGSARQDDNEGAFEDTTTWRVGGAYAVSPQSTLRASAGTGVKNPTFTELFGFFPGSFIGNSALEPETSTSWELGWDQTYGRVQTRLTYFQADLENEIFTSFTPSFFATPQNRQGESERSGVEAELNWQARENLSLGASLTNIQSTNETGADEIRVPEWTGSVSLDWRSLQKPGLRLGLGLDYVGEQLDTDFGSFPFTNVTLDPYWLASASLDYPLSERLALTLRGENLFDETVTDVLGFNGPGAGVFIGVRIR